MTAVLVKFPFKLARRAHARRPRKSKNGTPEERAAKRGAGSEDPIFAAIERHRQLDAAHAAACEAEAACGEASGHDASDAACDKAGEALANLVAITPTTLAGCATMLRYIGDFTHNANVNGTCGMLFNGWPRVEPAAADLLQRLADRIEGAQS